MNSGFSLLEIILVMAIGLGIMSIVIVNITQSADFSARLSTNQQKLESLFHTVDTIKSDLTRCGMRLQEAAEHFPITPFCKTERGYAILYGMSGSSLPEPAAAGQKTIRLTSDEYMRPRRKILIYSIPDRIHEIREIKKTHSQKIDLTEPLQFSYPANASVITLREIQTRHFTSRLQFKRKTDRGYFQPLLEGVTDFFLQYYPESQSVLYRLEINRKEQVRGYVFLTNMAKQ